MIYGEALLRLFFGVSVIYVVKRLLVPWRKTARTNLPPGPRPLPILGSLPYIINSRLRPCLLKNLELVQKYGKVMSFSFGPCRGVLVNDHNVLREAFQSMDCCGRPRLEAILQFHGQKLRGIIIQDGENWKQLRRFTLKQLREYGLGKNSAQVMMERECSDLVQDLHDMSGRPFSTQALFNIPIVNVLWEIIAGARLSYDDPAALGVINALITVAKFTVGALLAFFYPAVAKAFPRLSGWDFVHRICGENQKFVGKFVERRKLKHEMGDENDFTDIFLNKIKSTKDPKSDFYGKLGEENLVAIISDLFLAGTETSSTTLRWLLLYLAVYPEAQAKLQEEIDRVLEGKFPALDKRPLMPYTEAVIMETLRKSSLLPLGLLHSTTEDTYIGGYFIPKNTIVASNIYAIHHNPEVWDEPHEFRPERFLSSDGESVIKHDAFVPFSVGKRACPGEQLARDELFIFTTRIFQEFSVTWNNKKRKPSLTPVFSTAVSPHEHELIFTARNNSAAPNSKRCIA